MKYFWADTNKQILIELTENMYNNSFERVNACRNANFIYIISTQDSTSFTIHCTKHITEDSFKSPIKTTIEFLNQLSKDVELHNLINSYTSTSLNKSYVIIQLYNILNKNNLLNEQSKNSISDAIDVIKYERHIKNNKNDIDYFFPK